MPRCATSCRVVEGSAGSAGRNMDADTSIITTVGMIDVVDAIGFIF